MTRSGRTSRPTRARPSCCRRRTTPSRACSRACRPAARARGSRASACTRSERGFSAFGAPREYTRATGSAGDVFVLHPLLAHSSASASARPRHIINVPHPFSSATRADGSLCAVRLPFAQRSEAEPRVSSRSRAPRYCAHAACSSAALAMRRHRTARAIHTLSAARRRGLRAPRRAHALRPPACVQPRAAPFDDAHDDDPGAMARGAVGARRCGGRGRRCARALRVARATAAVRRRRARRRRSGARRRGRGCVLGPAGERARGPV